MISTTAVVWEQDESATSPWRSRCAKTVEGKGRNGWREVTYSTFSILLQRKLCSPPL